MPALLKFKQLDLTGLKCPLPVLKTRKALLEAVDGSCLEVISSDPLSKVDIPHLVQELGFKLLESEYSAFEKQGIFDKNNVRHVFRIEKTSHISQTTLQEAL